jgi:hypothetical protein
MATTAGFKQQCPSCEAMVPIRDPNLVGRKIDCPKCKYRFVVEDPGEAEIEEDEEERAPVKRRTRDDRTDGKSAKKGIMTREEAEEEEEAERKRAQKAGSTKLILVVGLGILGVVLVAGVTAVFLWPGDTPQQNTNKPGPSPTPAPKVQPVAKKAAPLTDESGPGGNNYSMDVLTNFLPPETEAVCNLRMQDLTKTPLGRAVYQTPGSFRYDALEKKVGFPVEEMLIMIQGWNFSKNWTFNTLYLTQNKLNIDTLREALHAKPSAEKIDEWEYFVLEPNPWLAAVGKLSFATALQVDPAQVAARTSTKSLAMHLYDAQTLIVADEDILKEFLKKGRVWEKKQAKPKVTKTTVKRGDDTEEVDPEIRGGRPSSKKGGNTGLSLGGNINPKAAAPKDDDEKRKPGEGTYLTIDQRLKEMMDRVDNKQPVISLAVDSRAASSAGLPPLGLKTLGLVSVVEDAEVIGAAVQFKDGVFLTLASEMPNDDVASRREDAIIAQSGDEIAAEFTAVLGSLVVFDRGGSKQTTTAAQAAPPRRGPGRLEGRGGAGEEGASALVFGNPPVRGDAGAASPRRGGKGGGEGGGGVQVQIRQSQVAGNVSTVQVATRDVTAVFLTVNLIDQTANARLFNDRITRFILRQKGILDMISGEPRIHELAKAAESYVKARGGEFPRGTAVRNLPTTRAGRPYPPDQRVSWLAALLPYLGSEQASLQIYREKSWRDPANLTPAACLIPQFLDPRTNENNWWVLYPTVGEPVAATHFVGIAGIGPDAAEYSASDPAVANKLGIFGYDRVTKMSDIKDRPENTIMMAEVPPVYKRPWIAGGGATVMGVPEKDSIKPFVCAQHGGKRGTYVIMADFKVRFIAETVSDEVFKAMCTINGGSSDASFVLNRDAVLIEPPEEKPPPAAKPKETLAPKKTQGRTPAPEQPAKAAPKPTRRSQQLADD